MYRFLPFIFILLLACKEETGLDVTEEDIDAYVADCLDSSKVYDIVPGLRYSRNDESYQVTEFSLEDTVILYNVIYESEDYRLAQNIYFMDELPVFLEEYRTEFKEDAASGLERKVYMNGEKVIAAYERAAEYEVDLDKAKFQESDTISMDDFDFDKPARAIAQDGEFELQFEDFLVINPESYLILENHESEWGAALFILQGDMLLDELYSNQEEYRNKTIYVQHEFQKMWGIERMIYRGGIVKEKD